jgi:outer membrane protein assembly factor BamB
MLTLLLLLAWGIIFTAYRWWMLLAAVLVAAGAGFSVRQVRFTGDMIPSVEFRWNVPRDDVLEAHRRQQGDVQAAIDVKPLQSSPADFPEYRGRQRDGVVDAPPISRDWKTHPPRLMWRQPVGGGYAAIAVAGNLAVTIEQRRDQEAVVCYHTATGKERWSHSYPARFTETLGGPGPRATPTIVDGDVYSLGAEGKLVCLELATAKEKWSVDTLQDNENLHWGMSGSPLVFGEWVVVNPGSQLPSAAGRALVAFNRQTGKPAWTAGNTRAGYSSPMLATLGGKQQILLFDGEGVRGFDASGGGELWHFDWVTQMGMNITQPLVLDGDRVFVTSAYDVGCAMLQVTESAGQWAVKPLWQNKVMRCKLSSPVAYQGHIYGLDEGILACVDQQTGARKWRDGRYRHGQVLLVNDLLLILSEQGQLAIVEASPTGFHELGKIAVFDDKTWNYHAMAGGKVFLRNHREMACYDLIVPGGE